MYHLVEFILKSRVKYVVLFVIALFFLILFLTTGDFAEEEEVLNQFKQRGRPKYKPGPAGRHLMNVDDPPKNIPRGPPAVPNFDVKFVSGKEMAEVVDGEKKSFQVHKVKVINMAGLDVRLDCEDAFSKFGRVLQPGGFYKFTVTDLFAKRHYWCNANFERATGLKAFAFRAYGEGAPRDNNVVTILKDGAFINGKNMNI